MGPIDIRYHVVSLVAVFLALGVGIIVGSNTNLIGPNTLIDKQDQIIQRVEKRVDQDMADMQKDMQEKEAALKASREYVAQLEQETVPALLEGKLTGARLGVALVGTLPDGTSESAVLGVMKRAGAQIGFKVKLPLEAPPPEAVPSKAPPEKRLAAELLFGAGRAPDQTKRLVESGSLLFGDFSLPVSGVVFILGTDLEADRVKDFLIPLEHYIRANRGVTANVLLGSDDALEESLRRADLPVFSNAQQPVTQAALVAGISNGVREQQTGR